MDADEIAALKKEKAAEAAGPECRCTKGEPENCNDSLNHKSGILPDVEGFKQCGSPRIQAVFRSCHGAPFGS